jgi:condensin complex subunit 3
VLAVGFSADPYIEFCTNEPTEEEKKLLGPLLGKLHVSPASSEDKIREVYEEVSTAIDDKLIADATGRNALFKIHVSLGKIVNSFMEKSSKGRRKSSPIVEDKTVLADEDASDVTIQAQAVKVEEEDDEGTILPEDADESKLTRDSLVEDLLSDDDVEMSGI